MDYVIVSALSVAVTLLLSYYLYIRPIKKDRDYLFQFTHPGRGATVWCKVAYYRADKQA